MYLYPQWQKHMSQWTQIIRKKGAIPAHPQSLVMHTWETICIRDLKIWDAYISTSDINLLQCSGSIQSQFAILTHLATIIFVIPTSKIENERSFSLEVIFPVLIALTLQLTCLVTSFSSTGIETFGSRLLRHHLTYSLHLLGH